MATRKSSAKRNDDVEELKKDETPEIGVDAKEQAKPAVVYVIVEKDFNEINQFLNTVSTAASAGVVDFRASFYGLVSKLEASVKKHQG